MTDDEIIKELDVFLKIPRAYTLEELLHFIGDAPNPGRLHSLLCNSPCFVKLDATNGPERFVSSLTLFKWFYNLNIKLALARKFVLSELQFSNILNHLLLEKKWIAPPGNAVKWGGSLGLVSFCNLSGQFVFPLAKVLSFLSPDCLEKVVNILNDFTEEEICGKSYKTKAKQYLNQGFSNFNDRTAYIIRARERLLTGKRLTLGEIGKNLDLTRERIRQIEKKFWEHLEQHQPRRYPFLACLLYLYLKKPGKLIFTANSPDAILWEFLAKCLKIPAINIKDLRLIIFSNPGKAFNLMKPSKIAEMLETGIVANYLTDKGVVLISEDMQFLSESIIGFTRPRLTKTQRVSIALQKIGCPAHYSAIAEVYNSLFPDDPSTEHRVHAALQRRGGGFVWIGAKGIYALKEWRFKRPSKTLFETVADIVKKHHSRTGRPVSIQTIIAEIGKEKKVLKPSSLAVATSCNPDIQQVRKDFFIPRDAHASNGSQEKTEISEERLDRIFRAFEEGLKQKENV